MYLLAFDLGDKRTGVAAGDDATQIVSPVDVIDVPITAAGGDELLRRLNGVIAEHAPARVVVGLPLNMDGTEGPASKKVRTFAARLTPLAGTEIVYFDERLTSADADWAMAGSGFTHKQKKERRDALAACAILRDYLASLPGR